MKKVILITGATSGIGFQTAEYLSNAGDIVYGAGRRLDRLEQLQQIGVHGVQLDVTDEQSMVSVVQDIMTKEGRIDVLINNAGYGSFGAVEDVALSEARQQFEVNLFGLARLTQLVLPHLTNDAIVAASYFVTALQTIVARRVDPFDTATVTIGSFDGAGSYNAIKDQVTLKGDVRMMKKAPVS